MGRLTDIELTNDVVRNVAETGYDKIYDTGVGLNWITDRMLVIKCIIVLPERTPVSKVKIITQDDIIPFHFNILYNSFHKSRELEYILDQMTNHYIPSDPRRKIREYLTRWYGSSDIKVKDHYIDIKNDVHIRGFEIIVIE